jgi:hypothetical protein
MKNFFFGADPQPLKIDALRVLFWLVLMYGSFYLLGWDTKAVWLVTVGLSVGLASKHVWWHFRPPKKRVPQPVTRYINPRYTKR